MSAVIHANCELRRLVRGGIQEAAIDWDFVPINKQETEAQAMEDAGIDEWKRSV